MSKSIEDYRNIVKILKLQLLKIREENATLSHDLGIASESETSCIFTHIQPSPPKSITTKPQKNPSPKLSSPISFSHIDAKL